MKALVLTLFFLANLQLVFAQEARADTLFGKKLEISSNQKREPYFSFLYSNKEHRTVQTIFFVSGINLTEYFTEGVHPVYASIFSKKTGERITPWIDIGVSPGGFNERTILQLIFATSEAPAVNLILKNLGQSALVFSFRKSPSELSPSAYIDFEELCEMHPAHFSDTDTDKSGCF